MIGTLGAVGLSRIHWKTKGALEYISILPLMIPEIILGMVLMAFLFALFVLQAYRSSLQGLGEMTVPTLSGFAEMLMRMGCSARAAGFHRAERRIFCGGRSMGVRGGAQSGLVLYPDWEDQAGYAEITKKTAKSCLEAVKKLRFFEQPLD